MIIPVFTEKSTKLAKDKKYTFLVPITLTKTEIKKAISEMFDVTVTSIKTINSKKMSKRNMRGKTVTIPATKKALVLLKKKKKLNYFRKKKKKRKGAPRNNAKTKTYNIPKLQ